MENFTPISALIGGAAIGIATAMLLFANGRIAGISGISGGLVFLPRGDSAWRVLFLAGLIGGALVHRVIFGWSEGITFDASWPLLVAGGLLVGLGTRLGGGCTSGHGVCGMARLSVRSIVAVVTFMLAAGVTLYIVRHVAGS
jgi:hypothetical protein